MILIRNLVWFLSGLCFAGQALGASVHLMVEDYPPYINQQAEKQGIITGVVVDAFARVNVASKVDFKSWSEVERAVDDDKALSFMWNKNKRLMKKWLFSKVIYQQKKQLLATQTFNRKIDHLHNLRGIHIGLVKGLTYGDDIEGYRRKLKLSEHVSDYSNLKQLLAKQQQLMIVDPALAVYLSSQFFKPEQKQQLKFVASPFFDEVSYYLVCAKQYGNCLNYIKKFNKGLAMLNKDGTLSKVFQQAQSLSD